MEMPNLVNPAGKQQHMNLIWEQKHVFTCQSEPRKYSTGSPPVSRSGSSSASALATKGVSTLSVECWYCSMHPLPFLISSSSSLSHVDLAHKENWKHNYAHFLLRVRSHLYAFFFTLRLFFWTKTGRSRHFMCCHAITLSPIPATTVFFLQAQPGWLSPTVSGIFQRTTQQKQAVNL